MSVSSRIALTLKSLLKSRLFVIVVVSWLITIIAVTFLSFTVTSLSDDYSGVPQYTTVLSANPNGSTVSVYTQVFDIYGDGVEGLPISYSLSLFNGQQSETVTSGNAGVTNASGCLQYNISGLNGGFYTLEQTEVINERSYSTYYAISQTFAIRGDSVFVSPVINKTDHSLYSIHLWRMPGQQAQRVTVQCFASPTLEGVLTSLSQGTDSQVGPIKNITLVNSTNVPTALHVYGKPYYYAVKATDEVGKNLGGYIFGPAVPPDNLSELALNSIYGEESLFLIFWSAYIAWTLCSGSLASRNKRLQKLLHGVSFPQTERRSSKFVLVLSVAVASSIPLIIVSQVFSYIFSMEVYGAPPSIYAMVGYALSGLAICAFSAASTMVLFFSGLVRPANAAEGHRSKRESLRLFQNVGIFALIYYFFNLNFDGFLTLYGSNVASLAHLVIYSDLFFPMSSEWLFGIYHTGNLLLVPYTIYPASYGLTAINLVLLFMAWGIILIAIPLIILRKKEIKAP